ncbi:MAG: hypothetical protein WAN75_48070 [Xanthobacteraceae bacterium]|jgi:hypothetical protein
MPGWPPRSTKPLRTPFRHPIRFQSSSRNRHIDAASLISALAGPRDDAQARQIFRDLIDMPADVAMTDHEVRVRFHRRAHLPIVLASGLIDKPVAVPWWNGLPLRLVE